MFDVNVHNDLKWICFFEGNLKWRNYKTYFGLHLYKCRLLTFEVE